MRYRTQILLNDILEVEAEIFDSQRPFIKVQNILELTHLSYPAANQLMNKFRENPCHYSIG